MASALSPRCRHHSSPLHPPLKFPQREFALPAAPLLPQYVIIGMTMVAVDLVVMGLYTGLAARLMRLLHSARRQAALGRVFSGLFATAAVGLSLMRRTASA